MSTALDPHFSKFLELKQQRLQPRSVQAVLALNAEGATVPFIARYRKEKTGNLDEVQIRTIIDNFNNYQELVKRKEFVVTEIEKQGNLTPELKKSIEDSWDDAEVEELYRPYKKKKKSKAKIARDAGLGPFADWIWGVGQGTTADETPLEVKAKTFLNPEGGINIYDEALQGAQHILIEKLSAEKALRDQVKTAYMDKGMIVSAKTPEFKPHSKYEMYKEYKEPAKNLYQTKASHRYLALRRGWQEGELKVTMECEDDARLFDDFKRFACKNPQAQVSSFLYNTAKTALQVHVIPSVTNELHQMLKTKSDIDAIHVFAENVRKVLMGSPFGPRTVLGVDPGIRTGSKIALIDKSGAFVSHTVLSMMGDSDFEKAKTLFGELAKQIKIDAIGVGNGTGGREAETFMRKVLKDINQEQIPIVMVNESGASVYSASDTAREEFPDLDITVRGAISIARRLQDPLSELVKIDPKSIGVGQYQHDVSQPQLKKSLESVVEDCVNQVGVNVNTASISLLQYVSGIGPGLAKNIVDYRKTNGLFKDRQEFLKVPHLSSKTFEQAAGFLRIPDGVIPLDRTGIHPERYTALREMAQEVGANISELMAGQAQKLNDVAPKWTQLIGEFTFKDLIAELSKPGRDPRDPFKVFKYREDVHEVKDLQKDMICPGLVTNVTNFGAFVDVGVHQDGLVHISELSHQFVEDPRQVVQPGDQVMVKVLNVDLDKKQISLSMLLEPAPPRQPRMSVVKRQDEEGQQRQPRREGGRPPRRDQPRDGDRPQKRADNRGPRRDDRGPRNDKRDDRGPRGGGDRDRKPQGKPFNNPFAGLNLKK